jgi:hypothetical protein
MASPENQNDADDYPTLESFYNNVDEIVSFLPQSMKNKYIAGKMRKIAMSPNNELLGSSPRAQKLKKIILRSERDLNENDRISYVNEAVEIYLKQKISETKPHSPPTHSIVPVPGTSSYATVNQSTTSIDLNLPQIAKKAPWHDVVESKHDNAARQTGWYVRTCKCYNQSCDSIIQVCSPNKDLRSSPARLGWHQHTRPIILLTGWIGTFMLTATKLVGM